VYASLVGADKEPVFVDKGLPERLARGVDQQEARVARERDPEQVHSIY